MRDIGKNIKSLRVSRKMTQDRLAEQLFVTRQTVSNYETGKSRPDIDMLVRIAEVLGTDIQQVIYGPEPKALRPEVVRLIIGGSLTGLADVWRLVLQPIAQEIRRTTYQVGLTWCIYFVIRPVFSLLLGWTLAQLPGMALRKKPLECKWARWAGAVLLVLAVAWFVLTGWNVGAQMVNEWQYEHHIRGEWIETEIEVNGKTELTQGWSMLPPAVPGWVSWFARQTTWAVLYPGLYLAAFMLAGAALWLCGVPWGSKRRNKARESQ